MKQYDPPVRHQSADLTIVAPTDLDGVVTIHRTRRHAENEQYEFCLKCLTRFDECPCLPENGELTEEQALAYEKAPILKKI